MTEAAASGPPGGRMDGLALRGPARLLSDERLSRRATKGDRRAFEEIFRRYHQDLYRFCLATVSNPQDAQEALQNTMVKVMRSLPGEEREIKLKPWLYRIARNEAIETLRKRRDTVEIGSERIAAAGEIADAASARERLRDLFSDLAELPERQRSALVMRELAGLDFEEIGEAFGTNPAVARQTLYEARQSLRQMAEGREMGCETVRQAISDADGRVTRRRDIQAHLRACGSCRAFRTDIGQRREEFAAIAPLPLVVSAGVLQGLLSGGAAGAAGGGVAGGGLAGTIGVGAGKVAVTSTVAKSAATIAVAAAVGVGAADRSGVIDLPTPGGGEQAAKGHDAPAQQHGRAESGAGPRHESGQAARAGEPNGNGRDGAANAASPRSGPGARAARRATKRRARGVAKPPPRSHGRRGGGRAQGRGGKGAPSARGGAAPADKPVGSNRGQQKAATGKPQPAPSSSGTTAQPSGKTAPAPARPPKAESAPPAAPSPETAPSAPSAPLPSANGVIEAGDPQSAPAEP